MIGKLIARPVVAATSAPKDAGDCGTATVCDETVSTCLCYVGVNKLGRIIALRLLANKELVEMGDVMVSVNYLVDMVRLTGIHGSFRDQVDDAFNMFAPAGPKRQLNSRL